MPKDVKGFVPGGADCVQWFFEGEWTEEEMQPIIKLIKEEVLLHRQKYSGSDMFKFWRLSYIDFKYGRQYTASRSGWLFALHRETIHELIEAMNDYNQNR